MKWRRGHRDAAPTAPQQDEPDATVSDETRRAQRAAQEAAKRLERVRAQGEKIDRLAEEIADLNRKNGFYLLIREALGSK